LYRQHGADGLRAMGYFGVLDRIERAIKSNGYNIEDEKEEEYKPDTDG